MPKFNPQDYDDVASRLRRFWEDHKNGRITTQLVEVEGDIGGSRWVVRAEVYADRLDNAPFATGYAFEVDGTGMANNSSALENCETSAIGRALANGGYSGDRRANREEIMKAFVVQARQEIAETSSIDRLKELWRQASEAGALEVLKAEINARVKALNEGANGAA